VATRRSGRRLLSDDYVEVANGAHRGHKATRYNPIPSWSTPGHPDWDIQRVLYSDECLAPDRLLKLPRENYNYVDSNSKLKNPDKYALVKEYEEHHPKLAELVKKGTDTPAHTLYYRYLQCEQTLPIAGIIRATPDPRDSVVREALRGRSSSENSSDELFPGPANNSDPETNGDFQEENFHARPSIKLIIPDHIKAILVDDWENVTKNLQLVPLPAAKPVNLILNDYLQYEKPKRQAGSAPADILDEVVAGLKEYFEKCLGRILLYR
jgi:hypothetical protein